MVSSLHASVLGTQVPGISSVQSTTSVNSTTSTDTTSSGVAPSYDSVSLSSSGQMMAAEGGHPPDFDSMDTEEFRAHLIELQETMAANGTDISSFTDPSTMSDEDLNALKDEMSSMGKGGPRGKQGPPPPPPQSTSSVTETEVSDDSDLLQLLESLQDEEKNVTAELVRSLLEGTT